MKANDFKFAKMFILENIKVNKIKVHVNMFFKL